VLAARSGGRGQVVDAAMVDGVSLLMSGVWSRVAQGRWSDEPGTNDIDSGAPFYDVYATSDGEYMAVGSIEPQFWTRLLDGLGLDPAVVPGQWDRERWPELKRTLAAAFAGRTRAEWTRRFDTLDACVTPVLRLSEAPADPHLAARRAFTGAAGGLRPAPAPRLGGTPLRPRAAGCPDDVLVRWGVRPPDRELADEVHAR
jgi:alpha-methylacyl-CoA racemase